MRTQAIALLTIATAAAVAVATTSVDPLKDFEGITGVKLAEKPSNLRAAPEYTQADLNTAKKIVLEAVRRMQLDQQEKQQRRLSGWGVCLKFWDCPKGQTFSDIASSATQAAQDAFSDLITELENSGELDQLQAVLRKWSSFDTRFDLYTYIIAITNAIESGNWRQEYSKNEPSDDLLPRSTFPLPPKCKMLAPQDKRATTACRSLTAVSLPLFKSLLRMKTFRTSLAHLSCSVLALPRILVFL